jgi:hypothetical protein
MRQKLSAKCMVLCGTILLSNGAMAGPPLICHPFQIEGAKSLPWGGGKDFNSPDPGYDVSRLAQDTLRMLAPDMPVIVRMETLRRAALYGLKDQRAEYELLARLEARALSADAAGKPDPLAAFDAGYLIETLKQVSSVYKVNLAEGLDGTALVQRAITSGGDPAAMEFAAALMGEHMKWPNEHYRRALRSASEGSLTARNLVTHSGGMGGSLAELRARYGKGE